MDYQRATIKDIPLLVDMRIEFLHEAHGKKYEKEDNLRAAIVDYYTMHMTDDTYTSWICIDNGLIVGTSGISFYQLPANYSIPNGNVGYIMNMYTKPPYRRKGIAKILFEKMIEEGTRKKVSKFILHATSKGKGLYEKMGFVMSGDEMHLIVR